MKDSSKNEYINDDYQYIYSKLLNLLMYNGKKNIARKIIDKALDTALLKVNESSKKKILVKAILNAAPDIEIKSPGIGLHPKFLEITLNQKLKRKVTQDHPLEWEDIIL